MSHAPTSAAAERCAATTAPGPVLELLPGRSTLLGDLAIRRLLPARGRRLVGPWCFLDAFGPLSFAGGKPMDVPPHPHIGLQTVSWLLDGEVLHRDSLGFEATGRPGTLNLMTAGRGIAHSEETPPVHGGRLEGVQLWVALPDAHRQVEPSFEHHADLPSLDLDGGRATVFLGGLGGRRSPGRVFSPIVGADVAVESGARLDLPLEPSFEHAVLLLRGTGEVEGSALPPDTLVFLGAGRSRVALAAPGALFASCSSAAPPSARPSSCGGTSWPARPRRSRRPGKTGRPVAASARWRAIPVRDSTRRPSSPARSPRPTAFDRHPATAPKIHP